MTMTLDGTLGITATGSLTGLTTAITVAQGGTGVTTSTGTGNNVLSASPTFTGQATIPTINLTGGQITFPATQSASADANTLDDYEEGSWTPALTTPGTATYSLQTGRYIKIGKLVFIQGQLGISAIGTGNGSEVKGLPYVPGVGSFTVSFSYFNAVALSVVYVAAYINTSADNITFTTLAAAATSVNNGPVLLTSSSNILFSACYVAGN